jgi:hypothetical protein
MRGFVSGSQMNMTTLLPRRSFAPECSGIVRSAKQVIRFG